MNERKRQNRECISKYLWKRRGKAINGIVLAIVFSMFSASLLPAVTLRAEEPHQHTDACYEMQSELTCTQEETAGHTHDEACYDEEGALICGQEESEGHHHTEACYTQNQVLTCGMTEAPLVTDPVPAAEAEENTEETPGSVTEEETTEDTPDPQNPQDKENHLQGDGTTDTSTTPSEGTGEPSGSTDESPQKGELICTLTEGDVHTHSAENGCYDASGNLICQMTEGEHHHTDACYGDAPASDDIKDPGKEQEGSEDPTAEEPVYYCGKEAHTHSVENGCYAEDGTTLICEKEEHTHTEACQASPESEYTCGLTEHTHSVENGCYAEDGTTLICEKEEHTHTSLCALSPEDREKVQAVIDLIDALPTEEEIEETFTALLEAEDEEGYEAALVDLIEKAKEAYAAYSALSEELQAMVTNADKLMALEAYWGGEAFGPGDPNFTVQYYANLPVIVTNDSNNNNNNTPLTVIDTSGGNFPKNGVSDDDMLTRNIYLEDAGNGKKQVVTKNTLTEVYHSYDYNYTAAPGLDSFDRLSENRNYALKEIWILKDGKSSTSTDRNDWEIRTYSPETTKFTNNSFTAEDDQNYILIEDKDVIRLVYDTTNATYTNAVNFYDYDITDGSQHTNIKGEGQGINSTSNYSGSGSKLAFGNQNTGTPYGTTPWNGNFLNAYNDNGFSGCTFGLVTGLDSDGHIIYADLVDAPKLFNEGDTTGKTSYVDGQYNLQFNRVGDTYTLSAVDGSNVNELEYFNNPQTGNDSPYYHIWTNNFWPMDGVTGKDGSTGRFTGDRDKKNRPLGCETYYSQWGTLTHYPSSDDGIAHNNMFGMQYSVQFTLTEDYTGPLEYYFFGDDDMWVFLDSKLVCDIGGVHSSVGEYVNLWDYLEKGSEGTHTLSFYYTERGLSGSTCYMQFTLPSVSSATPGQKVGSLTVEKEVTGQTSEQEFTFRLQLKDQENNHLVDKYTYRKMDMNEENVSTGVIVNNDTFTLRHNQRIIIDNLPYGTQFTVTETNYEGCIVTTKVNNNDAKNSNTASDTISEVKQSVTVKYINNMNPKLPSTGGVGTTLYTFGGLLLMSLPPLYNQRIRRRKRDRD